MPAVTNGFGTTRSGGAPPADMPSDRTFVTELATGLGMFGDDDLDIVMVRRPSAFVSLSSGDWDRLSDLWSGHQYGAEFVGGFLNGRAFLAAADALNGRTPRIVEWTGGRRSPGDEVVPSDLRIDHVYLVSCKYLSGILHNPSPARLVDGLLSKAPVDDARDWYERVAPAEYQELYEICAEDDPGLPELATEMTTAERRGAAVRLRSGWPAGGVEAYERLCRTVSQATADAWAVASDRIGAILRARLQPIGCDAAPRRHAVGLAAGVPLPSTSRRTATGRSAPGGLVGPLRGQANARGACRARPRRDPLESRSVRPATGGKGLPGLPPRGRARIPRPIASDLSAMEIQPVDPERRDA